ncbi:hypothetical protein GCM10009416_39020 [Craurococcus roseus]|uniref:Uncharacterized protein n=1 Tax=Craurococcus roseus TaxID=77585 RepID=A0ABP3QT85_9PROT
MDTHEMPISDTIPQCTNRIQPSHTLTRRTGSSAMPTAPSRFAGHYRERRHRVEAGPVGWSRGATA